jgi:hypothetical protein
VWPIDKLKVAKFIRQGGTSATVRIEPMSR